MALTIDQIGSLNRLTDSIQAQVPGVLYNVVRMALWDSVEDFCGRSGYWREIENWSITSSASNVQLATGDATKTINAVVEVYGLTKYRVQQPDTIVIVGGGVNASGTALVTLQPSSLDNTPLFIIQTWFEVLRSGALARLFVEPFKPYTNTELAGAFSNLYEQGILLAKSQAPQLVGDAAFTEAPSDLERLYQNITAELPDVPHTQVQLAAWNAIEDFYIRSTWRREHLYWQMPANVTTIDFNPFDANWFVAWVLAWNGLTSGKIEPPGLLRDLASPTPETIRSGEAWVALKPASINSELDPLLWQQWFDTILSGTLHRLYRQPGKTHSSPQLAMFHGKVFQKGISTARAIAHNNYAGNTPGWRFPYYAGGVTK